MRGSVAPHLAVLLGSAVLLTPLLRQVEVEPGGAVAHPLLAMVALQLAPPAHAQSDTTAPSLSSAAGSDTTLTLTYDETLDSNSVPAATAFGVNVNNTAVSLSPTNPVAISGMAVTLTLVNAVGIGKTVTVTYTVPTDNPIQDSAGNDAGGFTNQRVTVTGICDRTPAVQTAIVASVEGITNCADITSSHLSGMTAGLGLDRKNLSSLQPHDFNGLPNLEILWLYDNSLSSLDGDIFDGLSNLQYLYLQDNSLSSLDGDIFDGLANLGYLWLSDNSLSSLDGDIFDGLANLQILYLNNNRLSSLPEDLFSDSSLHVLALGGNRLVCLPRDLAGRSSIINPGSVRALPDCYGVSLAVNPTEVVEGSGGQAITVTASLTAGTRIKSEATAVTISVDSGTATEGTDFNAVSDFTITIASGSDSQTGTFTLTALTDAIAEAAGETVKVTGTTSLSSSSVTGTEVTEAMVTISDDTTAPSLSSAVGSDTTLTLTYDETLDSNSVPAATAFGVNVNDTAVSLSATNPVAISGMAVTLTLANAVGIGKTVTVTYTVPTGNPIQDSAGNNAGGFMDQSVTVTGICDRTPAVQTAIVASVEGITNCADITSSHLSGMTAGLGLDRKNLSSLQPHDFNGLPNLEMIWLNDNSLSSLDGDIFDGLANLGYLWLGDNSLSSLDGDIFDGLANLHTLWLDNNSLSSLPEDLFSDSSLHVLALGGNRLVCLPRDLAGRSSIINPGSVRALPDCYGVSLAVNPTEVVEGSGGQAITVTASLTAGTRIKSEATAVTISVDSGTATEGTDFNAVSDFTITIASGRDSQTGTFTLTALTDAIAEAAGETVKVTGTTSLSSSSVTGTEVTEAMVTISDDTTAPSLSSAVGSGTTLTLTYDETLDSNSVPAVTAFGVKVNNTAVSLSTTNPVAISGRTVTLTLTLANTVNIGKTVTVTYIVPTDNPIQDHAGNDAAALMGQSVTVTGICDRTPAVQTAIVAAVPGITNCADITSSHLSGMRGELVISNLSSLQANDFDGVSNLDVLNLADNSLGSLDGDIFDGLSNLPILFLNNNSLSSVDGDIFDGLSNLQRLFLNNNSLSSVDGDIFDGLSNLQRLLLNNNSLSSVDGDIFDGLSNLQQLFLYTNSLSSLDGDIFDGLSNLENLWLNDNRLSSLPEGLLSDSGSLTDLRLADNGLVCLPRDLAGRSSIITPDSVRALPDCYGVSLAVNPIEVVEGSGGQAITVTASLTAGTRIKSEATAVTISVASGTATEGTDFNAVSDFTITIASGSDSQTGTFTLTALTDGIAEAAGETVKVTGTTSLSGSSVTGTEVTEAMVTISDDNAGPSLSSAAGSDTTLTLTYDETLNSKSVPAATAFGVKVNNTAVSLSTTNPVAISGRAVTLTLANAVGIGKTVTVTYTVPTGNPIQDHAGNDAGGFMDQSVTVTGICDRTPAVQTAIVASVEGITNCADITSSHLRGITSALVISNLRTPLNKSHDFYGLSNLEDLYLTDNSLSSLHGDIFEGLSNLKYLWLNENRLSSLDGDIFNGLSNLRELYLQNNSLSSVDGDIFDGLSNLRTLYLQNNSLSSVDGDIFDGLSNLRYLYLDNNRLSSVDGDIFEGLSNLLYLYLDNNRLSSVDGDIFDGLSSLTRLPLSNNSLSSLDTDIFDGLSNLQLLGLGNNSLSSLDGDIFDGLSNLQIFAVHNNSLSSLPEDLFSDSISSLISLALEGNPLVCLPRNLANRTSIIRPVSVRTLPDCYGVSLAVNPTEVFEGRGGQAITVTASLTAGTRIKSAATAVTISVDSGTATEGTDFNAVSDFTITIASGSDSQTGTFTLTALSDAIEEEADETVEVTGTTSLSSSLVTGTEVTEAIVTILQVKEVSVVPISTVIEGTDASFRFSRTGPKADSLTVQVDVDGHEKIMSSATRAFKKGTGTTVTFAPGSSEAILNLTTEADSTHEGNGEITVTIASSTTYSIDINNRDATILVRDDEIPTVTLKWVSPGRTGDNPNIRIENNVWVGSIIEGEDISFQIECTGNTLAPVPTGNEGPPATNVTDLSHIYNRRIPFRFESVLNHPTRIDDYLLAYSRGPCLNDKAVTFPQPDQGYASGRRRWTGPDNGLLKLDILEQILDYHTIPGNVTSDIYLNYCYGTDITRLRGLMPPDDIRFCPQFRLGAVTSARIEVTNRNPVITVKAMQDRVAPGTPARFKLTRIWTSDWLTQSFIDASTTFDYTTSQEGGYVSNPPSGTSTFANGKTELIIEVPTTATSSEPGTNKGKVTLRIGDGSPDTQAQNTGGRYEVYDFIPGITPEGGNSREANVIISTDPVDNTKAVILSVDPNSVAENADATTVTITATLGEARTEATPVTVSVGAEEDSATEGTDYATVADLSISIPSGQTSATTTFTLTPTNDSVAEGSEIIRLNGSTTVTGLTIDTPTIITLTDDDTASTAITLSADPTTVAEYAGNTTITIAATLNNAAHTEGILMLVDIGESGDSATQGTDYWNVPGFNINIPAGQTSSTASFILTPIQDIVVEGSETISLRLKNIIVAGANLPLTTLPIMISLTDDDTAGVTVDPTTLSMNEGGSGAYRVKLNTLPPGNVTITPSSGDAAAATASPAMLTFTTSNWNTAQTVTVTGVDDGDAVNETVTVSHGVSGYGSVSSVSDVTVTVNDNDTVGVAVDPTTLSMNEGGSGAYTVKLNTLPPGNVTITPSSGDAAAATASPATLTFTPSNWDTAQTVTVTGVDDGDTVNETVTVSHGVSGYGSVSSASDVTVTVNDEDIVGVAVDPTTLSMNEGESGTYTVKLNTLPTGNVTITPSSGDADAATVSPATLTLTPSNWNTAQTVTVSGAADDDAVNETVTVSHSVSGYDSVSSASDVTVTVNDNDTAGVTVDPTALSMSEGGSGAYTVKLNTQPTGNVTITPSSGDADAATVSPATLTLTPSNWNTAQTVTVSGAADDDAVNETVTLSHSVSGYDSVSSASDVTVTVNDTDTAGVTVGPTALSMSEGLTDTYTVKLNTQPTGNVTITPSSGDADAATASPATLTFTTSNWNTAQTVTVSGEADDDAVNETVTVSHSVSGYDSVSSASDVTVTVNDTDTAGVTVDPTTLSMNEGLTDTYTVKLNTQPTGDVTITPSSGDAGAATASPATLTFTPSNWNTAQTVTVSGEEDDDAVNETVTLSHGVSGYGSVTTASNVTVTVNDNDTDGVAVDPTALSMSEGGSGAYTVKLNTQPTGDVTITLSSGDTGAATVSPATLTLTPSNWNTAQTVTVSGEEDDDAVNETVTLSHGVSGYGSVTTASDVTVTVNDNDTDGVAVDPTALSMSEGGSGAYTVKLNTQPTGNVTITPSSGDAGAATVSPATLTFTASNWNTAQTVTVSGEEDDDAVNETVTVSHSVSGYDSVSSASDVTVTVNDTDTAGVTVGPTALSMSEGGSGAYTVKLNTQPTGNVTITPSSGDTGAATAFPATLTFTPSNWNTAQTVTVTGVDDDDAVDETVTLSHGVSGYGSVSSASDVTVTVNDTDTAGVTVGPTTLSMNEGLTDTYTVKLNTQPTGNVTITPSSGDAGAATVSPATLTFTPSNWNTAQTVTVSGEEDDDAVNETVTLSHGVSGYGSVSSASDVTVTVNDTDTAGVTVGPTTLSMNEGLTDTYTVKLNTQPTGNVTITPSSGDAGAATASPATLTFTPSNWNTAQTVTVTGMDDDDAVNETVTLSHSVSGYDSVSSASDVTVTVNDTDTDGVAVDPTALSMSEGGSGAYTVKLNTQPTGNVTITLSSGDTGAATASPATLTFTPSNWNTAQTVAVSGEEDDDAVNETVTVSHSVSGYGSVSSASDVTVTVNDTDTAGVAVGPTALSMSEGGSGAYTVKLNTQPTGDVTITLSSGDTGAATASPATLTFTPSNWNTAQTVTVSGEEDDDAVNETVTFSHGVSGYGSVSSASDVTVTVNDKDTAGVTVGPTTLSMNEGLTDTYTVKLNTQPTGNVTITPSSGDAGAATASPATLTFTPSNWNTAQTVTVTGMDDDDAVNETVTLSHGVSGYDSVSSASDVTVTVNDTDTDGVAVDPTALSMSEGGSGAYTVKLNTQPTGNVTITLSSGDTGAATASPATLTFTPSNWNTAQTVTVSGEEDDDAINETVTVSHSVSGYDSVSSASDVTVTVNDNDTDGVAVDPTALSMSEGGSGAYRVKLNTLPTGNVTITLSSGDTGAATAFPATLTFTPSNWNTAQTVTVSGEEDDDAVDETVTVSHSVSGYDSVTTASNVTVTVNDNDTAGVAVDPTALSMSEGRSGAYTVKLNTLPTGNVTITPSSGDEGAATAFPATLTFTPSNWNTAQTVTVIGVMDDDAVDETVTLSHGVSGYGSVTTASNVTVTVNDKDTDGVAVDPTTLSMNEGESGTYTVKLNTLPTGNVTITPSSGDEGVATASPATLTFTPSNWNTAQTVTVTGVVDDDAVGETVTLSHGVSGYGSVSSADAVTVTVEDYRVSSNTDGIANDKDTDGVAVDPTTLSMNEGESGAYTVKLNTLPTGNVTITPSSGDEGAATASPATLTFTTSNWNTAQTVTVTGVEDDDTVNEMVTVSHGVSGYGSVTTASNVTVTVNDNDTAGVSVNPTTLSMSEGGSGAYTVKLNTQPTGNVTITPSSDDAGAATVSPATLTFTPSNWNTAQTVTVTGVEDDDTVNEMVTVSHGVSGYGSVTTASNVTVTVNDNDTAGVSVNPTTLSMSEGGSGAYTVKLNTQPTGNVTITPSSDDAGAATVSHATLTFTPSNWNTAQTVTVTGVEDDDTVNETVTVSHGVSGYGSVTTASNVTVTVNDNDTAGVSVNPTTLSMSEGGSGAYTVKLNTQPTGNVTITPSSDDAGAATVSHATLTFTPSNWNTAQTVTATGVVDDDAVNETVTVSHGVSGYGSVSSADAVTVTVNDNASDVTVNNNDTDGVSVYPTTLSVYEDETSTYTVALNTRDGDHHKRQQPGGGTFTYTVVLNTQPTGNVTITPSSGDAGAATASPATLTFTPSNWNTAQTVTVTGLEDDDAVDETVTLSHGVIGYGSVTTARDVNVTVNDNDTAGVTVDPTTLSMSEGGSGAYTVKLDTQPMENVTITPSSSDAGAATASPATLTFTPSNWNTAQTVTVIGVVDDDAVDETVTVSHGVSGYGSVTTARDVTVTVNDDGGFTGKEVLKGWLSRFGRSVAQQVLDRVSHRLQHPPQPGLEVSVAGEQLSNRGPWEEEQGIMAKLLGFETISEGQLVEGTEFAFSPHQQQEHGEGNGNGESLAFWGAGELGSFSGQQGDISLSGDVTTALVGADWHRQRWQAGATLTHSWGGGGYEERSSNNEGRLNANLTGLFPYGRYALNDHLSIWGVVGHSWGHITISRERYEQSYEQQSTDIRMTMGALGLDGLLLDGGGDGVTIRSSADALLLGVSPEENQSLAGVQGEVSRLRVGLEAERPFPISRNGAVLTPSLELGLRQDGGDAETGVGVDMAAALLWSDPPRGIEVELRGRTMVIHGDQAFHDQGLGISLAWDPNPSSSLGPSLSLSQSMGASATSGSDTLLESTPWPELTTSGSAAEGQQQFAARMGYGFLVYKDALLITPKVGVSLSSDDGTTSLGFSLSPYIQQGYGDSWEVALERQQHISGNGDNPTTQHSLDLRFSLLF